MFYAETTPELQAYGPDSFLCRRAMGTYCKPPTRSSATDPGCFVWTSNTTVTSTKLSFDCQNGTECYGSGWNVGSPTASMACEDSFAFPQRMCHLRECKPDHAPLVDMTALWFYPEAYFTFVFTMEFSLRLYATKRRCKLVQSMGSWLDIGAVIPFYAEVAASWMEARPTLFAIVPTFPTVMSVLPILKTLRVLKMGKRIQIQIDKLTIVTDMWRSTWLSIVTYVRCSREYQPDGAPRLTTVGYGDLKPRTPVGRFIDILVMVFGSCYTAMPLSLIGGQFYYCYEQYFKQQQRGNVPDAPRNPLEAPAKKSTSVLSVEDIDILKKCGVVVLLLDEMMQNVYKLMHATSSTTDDLASEQPKPHGDVEGIDHSESMNHFRTASLHGHMHVENLFHRSSDFGRRTSGGGNLSGGFLGRGSVTRVTPVNNFHRASLTGQVDNQINEFRRRRELIQTAATHLTVTKFDILFQVNHVMF
ncbi:hypothetical protein DYB32_003898 [Aphanomyces invadans]|uniref:Potassium channel domain-containing protein n=1 Tax=Aphanomyces invadans TaxID=157072 RepID=A0A3R6ZRS1_9STRA|nr:hypothetical protein DYB32_003898 [Aphanomyces invadans]